MEECLRLRPDFMGIWVQPSGKIGYFFMYPEGCTPELSFCGSMEDTNGKAVFTGQLDPDKVKFEKRYVRPIDAMIRGPIIYDGTKINHKYEGKYICNENNGIIQTGRFILEEYTPSETLDAIVDILTRKNELGR